MSFGIIYIVENAINNKKYIGQTTKDLNKRQARHIYEARACLTDMPFHKALIKHGISNFIWNVLEKCDSKEELDEMEFHYIKQYNSYRNGYNITLGGDGACGVVFTEERREKARTDIFNSPIYGKSGKDHPMYGKHHSERTKRKISRALSGKNSLNYGKTYSLERRNNISQSLKGRNLSEENKRKISETRKRRKVAAGKNNPMYGTVGKLSPSAKKYKIITPDGREFVIHGLRKFCRDWKEDDLKISGICDCANNDKILSYKGYKCEHIN